MPLYIVRNDITKMKVDAIVNAANSSLTGGGGVDGAIHRAAGPGLLEESRRVGGCKIGEAKITGGYQLPCMYVIHTVGPIWRGGLFGERRQLENCYRNALILAKEYQCESIAFPLIASGTFGYPKDKALKTAVDAISAFLLENEMKVYLVVYDRDAFRIGGKLFADIASYIDDHYVDAHYDRRTEEQRCYAMSVPCAPAPCAVSVEKASASRFSLEEMLATIDESFSEMLLRKIDEKGMKDSQCYKKANIDRKLFSKIKSDRNYKPSKPTVIAFAIALELDLAETKDMLMKAGFALSHSNKFDIIVEYFINKGIYDIYTINEALFAFDQSLLGAGMM